MLGAEDILKSDDATTRPVLQRTVGTASCWPNGARGLGSRSNARFTATDATFLGLKIVFSRVVTCLVLVLGQIISGLRGGRGLSKNYKMPGGPGLVTSIFFPRGVVNKYVNACRWCKSICTHVGLCLSRPSVCRLTGYVQLILILNKNCLSM